MSGIVSLDEIRSIRAKLQAGGKIVVFTNGVFDLLHVGHVDYLQRAKELGDTLIVGLNSDASTRAVKGNGRPIIPQFERATVLAALACVDYVVIFEEMTANSLVEALKPGLYVKGGDWGEGHAPPEAEAVMKYGGQVCILPYLVRHSTTRIIEAVLSTRGRRFGLRDLLDGDKRRDLFEALLVVALSTLYIPWGMFRLYVIGWPKGEEFNGRHIFSA